MGININLPVGAFIGHTTPVFCIYILRHGHGIYIITHTCHSGAEVNGSEISSAGCQNIKNVNTATMGIDECNRGRAVSGAPLQLCTFSNVRLYSFIRLFVPDFVCAVLLTAVDMPDFNAIVCTNGCCTQLVTVRVSMYDVLLMILLWVVSGCISD